MIENGAQIKIFSIRCDDLVYTIVAQRPDQIYRFDELLDHEISILYGRREELTPDDRSAVESALFQDRYHQMTFGEPPQLDDGLFRILATRANQWLAQDFLDLEAAEDNRLAEDIELSADEREPLDDLVESARMGYSPASSSPRYSFSDCSTGPLDSDDDPIEWHTVELPDTTA